MQAVKSLLLLREHKNGTLNVRQRRLFNRVLKAGGATTIREKYMQAIRNEDCRTVADVERYLNRHLDTDYRNLEKWLSTPVHGRSMYYMLKDFEESNGDPMRCMMIRLPRFDMAISLRLHIGEDAFVVFWGPKLSRRLPVGSPTVIDIRNIPDDVEWTFGRRHTLQDAHNMSKEEANQYQKLAWVKTSQDKDLNPDDDDDDDSDDDEDEDEDEDESGPYTRSMAKEDEEAEQEEEEGEKRRPVLPIECIMDGAENAIYLDSLFYHFSPPKWFLRHVKQSGKRAGDFCMQLCTAAAEMLGCQKIILDDASYDGRNKCHPSLKFLRTMQHGSALYERHQFFPMGRRGTRMMNRLRHLAEKKVSDTDLNSKTKK